MSKENEYHSPLNRFLIIVTIAVSFLVVGLPCWYLTTSVERNNLPLAEIENLNNLYYNNINYNIPVKIIDLPDHLNGFYHKIQSSINEKLELTNCKNGITILNIDNNTITNDETNFYKLQLIVNEDDDKLVISPFDDKLIKLFITPDLIKNNLIDDLISRVLIENLFNLELSNNSNNNNSDNNNNNLIKFPFSKEYKISINLLHSNNLILKNEQFKQNIKKNIKIFKKFIDSFNSFSKFTINFQELWYEERKLTIDEYKIDNITYIKNPSMFIDYSDWGLDQDVELNPIINLNLYLSENEILKIENSEKNSFIIPQWGSVIIINENDLDLDLINLDEYFKIFSFQILKLLGIDTNNINKSIFFSIDELIRIQTKENINNCLNNFKSLNKLINQLNTIPIPSDSVEDINKSIDLINESVLELNKLNWLKAFKLSTEALELSNKAFFHKDMVQQAYFPEEHKMAVYSPLLGPLFLIIIMAIIRGVKEIRTN